jgi:hypothetical protein
MTRKLFAIAATLLLALVFSPALRGENLSKEMIVTVNRPIALPEHTILTPGKYDMRFVDPGYSIVAVSHLDGKAIGLYPVQRTADRSEPVYGNPEFVLGRLPNGHDAIKEWFYPGDTTGFAFIYPQPQPVRIAMQQTHSAVVSR